MLGLNCNWDYQGGNWGAKNVEMGTLTPDTWHSNTRPASCMAIIASSSRAFSASLSAAHRAKATNKVNKPNVYCQYASGGFHVWVFLTRFSGAHSSRILIWGEDIIIFFLSPFTKCHQIVSLWCDSVMRLPYSHSGKRHSGGLIVKPPEYWAYFSCLPVCEHFHGKKSKSSRILNVCFLNFIFIQLSAPKMNGI